jgi:hypothetical protein
VRGILAAVLVFEGLVVFFATLVAKDLSGVDSATVWWLGGTTALACVLLAGFLRRRWALVVGSVLQLVIISAGVVVPAMFFLGAIFAALWFFAIHLGRRVERLGPRLDSDTPL